ncbi:hypothetical protein CF15_02335 [Pyrodictium occultum]|uniref:Uncharacterized protein n=1 Tax=Pyrodictium occultum TaxID=2309 RepID=A0A0V8RUC1_PYROC|nr:DUF1122 family protein [Pyrodictium occultum]KSW11678.1 hypothetical protein CF15_02335 [Pyrodictium occultum]
MARLETLVALLKRMGLKPQPLRKPRIREMHDVEVLAENHHLAYIRLFEGRPPYYRGWLEIYGIDWSRARQGLLEKLVEAASGALEPGETLFIEYAGDRDTDTLLDRGARPEETWIGRMLAAHGFTGIADMYFPEGFMEGGPKLRAVKPLSGRK